MPDRIADKIATWAKFFPTTLHDASSDSSASEYLVENTSFAISFDKVKDEFCSRIDISPLQSCDALLCLGDDSVGICLIEFKNGKVKTADIAQKALHSLLILLDEFATTTEKIRSVCDFCLVYNGAKHPREKLINHIEKKAQSSCKGKGIEFFNVSAFSHWFRSVHAVDNLDFENYLSTRVQT
jgi:hypothetical protein